MTQVRIRDRGDGVYLADVGVDTEDGEIIARASGPDGAAALDRAAAIADRIVNDPIMSALIPPQAKLGVESAKLLAGAAQAGADVLSSLWSRLRGPGKKRLAKVLLETTHGEHRLSGVGAGGVVVGPGRGGSSGRRTGGRVVIRSGAGGTSSPGPGFVWVPDNPATGVKGHWERAGAQAQQQPPGYPPGYGYDPWGNPIPPYGTDPYAAGGYYGQYQPAPYPAYGGYPGVPGYGGMPYPPMPYDPWSQYGGGTVDPWGAYGGGYLDAIMQDQQSLEQIFAQGGL